MSAHWEQCKALSRAAWTRCRAFAHRSIEHAAAAAGIDRSHLSRWESERGESLAPLAALWSRELVPDDEFEALVDAARRDRAQQRERGELATPKGVLVTTSSRATDLLQGVLKALSDDRVTPEERAELRPLLRALASEVRRTLKVFDQVDTTRKAADNVVGISEAPKRRVSGGAR